MMCLESNKSICCSPPDLEIFSFLGKSPSWMCTNNFYLLYFCISQMFTEFSSSACIVEQSNGNFVFSGMFHLMLRVEVGQGILLFSNIF